MKYKIYCRFISAGFAVYRIYDVILNLKNKITVCTV